METSNAPRKCFIWLVVFVVALVFVTWDGTKYNLRTDGPIIALESKATMRQRFDKDTINTILQKGDSVQVYGIDRSSFGQKWLVRTSNGNLGWIDASDVTGIKQIVTDGSNKGDTVSVKAEWFTSYIRYYTYVDREGTEHKNSTDDFTPAMEGLDDFTYDRDAISGVCTQSKFENKSIGQSYEDVNRQFGLPVLVHVSSKGIEAQYSWKTFDPSTGFMTRPTVTFGADSIAEAVAFGNPTKRAAGWLKRIPLASSIIDWQFTTWMVRTSRYSFAPAMPSTAQFIGILCLIPVMFLLYGIWMFAAQTIPTLLMGWLMVFPPVFAFLKDSWLRALIFVVAMVSCYIWSVIMMAWGMFPFWTILIFIVGWYAMTLAVSPLCTYPHIRCPKCHHMYTIKFDHEEFDHSEIKTGSEIVRGRLLGRRTEKWKTWTHVTTVRTDQFGNKSTTSYDKDVRHRARDYTTYEFIDYEVTYRLDYYRQYFVCDKCGLVEESMGIKYTLLNRKRVGTHTDELAGEEYGSY